MNSRLILLALFFFDSCITPYPIGASIYHEALVVQGMITDQPGPYSIIVSRTVPVQSQEEDSGLVYGASVEIKDDQGNSEVLVEGSTGHFYTKNIQGVVGNTYTITITTSDGSAYESDPEKLVPVGDFSLSTEFQQNEEPLANLQFYSTNGFTVKLTSDVLPEQENRVWWRTTGTYHIRTHPELRLKPAPAGLSWLPDPPTCSGYVVDRKNILMIDYVGPCTCCDCWITEYNSSPLLSDLQFVVDDKIQNLNIGFIQTNRRTMYDKYVFQVEQLSLSEAVYDFWKAVKIQTSNSSNLFQVPPPKTTGNIKQLNANSIPVIGYFSASSVKTQLIQVGPLDVPYVFLPMDTITQSCLDTYRYDFAIGSNVTNQKPLFW